MDDVERKLRDLGERTARDAAYRAAPAGRIVRRARLRRALTMAAPAVAVALVAGVALPRVDWPGRRAESSTATLATAIGATEEAGTARVDVEFEFRWDSDVAISHATGVIDFETGRTRLEATYSDDGQERVVEMVTDGTRTFERPVGSDDKWSERPLPPGAAAGPPDWSPGEFLDYLESVASEVTRVGTDIRDGESMTRYRAVIDPAKVEAASPQEMPDDLQLEYDPMDVWVDEQGRFREATFGSTVTMDDFEQTMRGTMRLYDFGVEADIELPSPDEIRKAPSTSGAPRPTDVDEEPLDLPDAWFVTGEGGLNEAHLVVSNPEGPFSITCVRGFEIQARVTVIDEETGRRVYAFPRWDVLSQDRLDGCIQSPAILEEILDDPSRFTLRLHNETGWGDVVMTTSGPGAPPP